MTAWKLQDAKNRFSEVVDQAYQQGPQLVSRHGKPAAVVISFEEYKKLSKPAQNLVEFMKSSPLFGVSLDLERDNDTGRSVEL